MFIRQYYAIQSTIFNILLTQAVDYSFVYICCYDSPSIQYLHDISFALGLLVWRAIETIDI